MTPLRVLRLSLYYSAQRQFSLSKSETVTLQLIRNENARFGMADASWFRFCWGWINAQLSSINLALSYHVLSGLEMDCFLVEIKRMIMLRRGDERVCNAPKCQHNATSRELSRDMDKKYVFISKTDWSYQVKLGKD